MNEQHPAPRRQRQIGIPPLGELRHRHAPPDLRSYAEQVVRAGWLAGSPQLVPIDEDAWPERISDAGPGPEGWSVVSAWNPGGRPTTLEENLARHEALTNRLAARGGRFVQTAVWAPDRRWAEQAVAVPTPARAAEIAQHTGAPGFVQYSGARATVWDAGSTVRRVWAVLAAPCPATCPVLARPGDQERCAPQGGPWVQAARQRAAQWHAHRAMLREVLGCPGRPVGECGRSDGGTARFAVPVAVASRWGDPVVLPG